MSPDGVSDRLSLNQITVQQATLEEAVDRCAVAGIRHIGLWRHKVAEVGVARAAQLCASAGLAVSSLCRGGFFTGHVPAGAAFGGDGSGDSLAENRRAVDEACALGTEVLVLVCGGSGDGDLAHARHRVAEGIAALVPYARERGVRLGIEPLHPMYCGDRSVVVTLAQALELAEAFAPGEVGVVIDAFHVWWDPGIERSVERASGRIAGFHVCDWLLDAPDMVTGRGMMGDGVIALRRLRELVDAAGYDGPIEVEVLNRVLWGKPAAEVVELARGRFAAHVA